MRDGCVACPRRCGGGKCSVEGLRIARYGRHDWEEPIISGSAGSGAIFFSGCNLKCVYCQNYEISHFAKGYDITHARLADIFKELEDLGMQNINLVTPSHFVDDIIKAIEIYKPKIPVVYNTSGYDSVETINKLTDIVDIYLSDMKYLDNFISKELSGVDDYFTVASAAIKAMRKTTKIDVVENDIMKKGLIIRHLVLPNMIQNSLKFVEFVKENFNDNTYLSLMSQYTPCGEAVNDVKLSRKIKTLEYDIVLNKLLKANFNNTFVQDCESATTAFIPSFEGENLKK